MGDRSISRPTFCSLTDSYEGWAHRTGLTKQLARLEQRNLVERGAVSSKDRLYRLTLPGRLQALGGRDPDERWNRHWDGQWRLVLFDVPTSHNARRDRLRRYLRGRGFGYLQNSVWIAPDRLDEEQQMLKGSRVDVESLILLEARPCAAESDVEIVNGAWDFKRINAGYLQYLKMLEHHPSALPSRNEAAVKSIFRWMSAERDAWLQAVTEDPLLPQRLLPSDYVGQQAWRQRTGILREVGDQLRKLIRK